MTRSRSNTPPRRPPKAGRPHRVEFSPDSSIRRDSNGQICNNHQKLRSRDSAEREKQRRLELVARAKYRREKMLTRVRREKKFMLFSSLLAFLAMFLRLAAVFTDHWFYVIRRKEIIEKMLEKSSSSGGWDDVFVSSNTGLWRTCQNSLGANEQTIVECSYVTLFLGRDESSTNPTTLNEHVIDYTRAQICFAIISVLLMIMTIVSAFYTFKNSRYVYKRLAACLYFMTTISILVVLEVLGTSVNYAEGKELFPGFSYYMGWSVFLVYLVNGCIFLVLSRKNKYDLEDDSEQFMGR